VGAAKVAAREQLAAAVLRDELQVTLARTA
jgi:hypothetical protein